MESMEFLDVHIHRFILKRRREVSIFRKYIVFRTNSILILYQKFGKPQNLGILLELMELLDFHIHQLV